MCGLSTVVTPAGASLTMYREIRSYANSIWDDNNNMKTGSENITAIMRKRRILFAGSVARLNGTRLPKCVMFGEVGGACYVGGQGKEWMGCLLYDLRAFGINADQ